MKLKARARVTDGLYECGITSDRESCVNDKRVGLAIPNRQLHLEAVKSRLFNFRGVHVVDAGADVHLDCLGIRKVVSENVIQIVILITPFFLR